MAAPRRRRISRTSCLRHRNARSTLPSIRFLDIAPFWSRWISQPAPYHINQIQNATKTNPLTSGLFWKELLQTTDRCRRIRKLVSWYLSTNQNKIRLLHISEDISSVSQWFTSFAVCTWPPSCLGWCQMPETNNGCSGGSVYSVLDSALFAWNRSAGWVKTKVWDSWDWKENLEKFQVRSVSIQMYPLVEM